MNAVTHFGHYRRLASLPFTAADRERVTVLFGGLTWKHQRMIQAVMQGNGYKCHGLPEPTREAHEIGREFCSNNLCNPTYFTIGNLILYLRDLEASGLSRGQIVRDYVFFTAGSNGPCRFGMYEAEYRIALHEAGYEGFRVLLFQQDHGIKAESGEIGMKFSADFGLDALHAFILGDLLNDLDHQLRPYETRSGEVEEAVEQVAENIAHTLQHAGRYELRHRVPVWLRHWLNGRQQTRFYRNCNTTGKVLMHLYGRELPRAIKDSRQPLEKIEVDWLRVRPVVRVIGEFWAQQTEGDGNFQIFRFLEKEGAEVSIEPLSNWVMYLLNQFRERAAMQYRLTPYAVRWRNPVKASLAWLACKGKQMLFNAGERIYLNHYARLSKALGAHTHGLIPQPELAHLAEPYYCHNLRGGEGHLEVAKNLYYTKHRLCHMVLAIKPFGCMPSMQSDAVQAGLTERYPEMTFLSVETAAEGEIHCYSRVQMTLAEARAKSQQEFQKTLRSCHGSLEEIRAFVAEHAEFRSPFYAVRRRPGIISTAANFLLDVDERMQNHAAPLSHPHRTHSKVTHRDAIATNQEF
jgi:predicted nucleotide-binding protein (sugar kinase/HSP70/actin superfamily)